MNALEAHCRKLSKVVLFSPLEDREVTPVHYADLLISYGSQLAQANLDSVGREQASRVARECGNVRCTVIQRHNEDFSLINIIGDRADVLYLIIDYQFVYHILTL